MNVIFADGFRMGRFRDLRLSNVSTATHRAVVRVAAVASLACSLILGASWLISDDTAYLLQTIGPAVAATIYALQVITRKENAAFALVVAEIIVMVSFRGAGISDTSLGALMGLWTITVVGAFIVESRPLAFVVGGAVWLGLVPIYWRDMLEGEVAAAVTMVTSFLITSILILSVRASSAESDYRFRRLFNSAPVALMDQDWGDALTYLRESGVRNETDLMAALEDDEVLDAVVSRVQVRRANAKAAALLGIPASRLLGGLAAVRRTDGSGVAYRGQIMAAWQGRPGFKAEYEIDKPRNMWVRVETVSTEVRSHSERMMVSITDITALKDAQSTLEELVSAKDAFIASISHELRTPLAGVVGLSAALLDGTVTDPVEHRELLEIIANQSQELSFLVEDLLVGARADIGTIAIRPQSVDLTEEMTEAMTGLMNPPETMTSGLVLAHADPIRVRQIIRNLVVNAQRYGGEVRKAGVCEVDGMAAFEMFDSGDPIPENLRQHIFEPYGRAHRNNGTTESVGLGLAVSRQLAELMGGTLDYHYEDGAVFRLMLPLDQVKVNHHVVVGVESD